MVFPYERRKNLPFRANLVYRTSESCGWDSANYLLSSQYQTTLCGLRGHYLHPSHLIYWGKLVQRLVTTLHPCEAWDHFLHILIVSFDSYSDPVSQTRFTFLISSYPLSMVSHMSYADKKNRTVCSLECIPFPPCGVGRSKLRCFPAAPLSPLLVLSYMDFKQPNIKILKNVYFPSKTIPV
jgi:hypothetical protein